MDTDASRRGGRREGWLESVGAGVVRNRKRVLAFSAIAFVGLALLGAGTKQRLSAGGMIPEGAESTRALDTLVHNFGGGEPGIVLIVHANAGTVDDGRVADFGRQLTTRLAGERDVTKAMSYWSIGAPSVLRSADRRDALVLGFSRTGSSDSIRAAGRIADEYTTKRGIASITVTGPEPMTSAFERQSEKDLVRAEMIAIPLTLLLLLWAFRGVLAAVIPLAFGVAAIVGTLASLRVLLLFVSVSTFGLNLATALGIALGIDYSLFLVYRFREELGRGTDPETAAVQTVVTAGRTVVFSSCVAVLSMATLLLFPLPFLRSMGVAAIAVSAFAGLIAIVPLPALLATLGTRIGASHRPQAAARPRPRLALRHPVAITVVLSAVLIVLAGPFLRAHLGSTDERNLSTHHPARQAMTELRASFTTPEASAIPIAVEELAAGGGDAGIDRYARALSKATGIARVDTYTGSYVNGTALDIAALPSDLQHSLRTLQPGYRAGDVAWLRAVPASSPDAHEAETLTKRLRHVAGPSTRAVGGYFASGIDMTNLLGERLPLALTLVVVANFVLMFLMFGSLVVPLKALLLTALSLTATFGAMVLVFQDGHFAGLLDFTPMGVLFPAIPMLAFALAFGLSMDYEVMLLSRIAEEYRRTGDNDAAIEHGLEQTRRLVTAGALIVSVVLAAFLVADIQVLKLLGLTVALAVLMDAFLIRTLLVPAVMKLMGDANWWAPRPLGALHRRYGISEGSRRLPVLADEGAALGD